METTFFVLMSLGLAFLLKGLYCYFAKHKRPHKFSPVTKTFALGLLLLGVLLFYFFTPGFLLGITLVMQVAFCVLATLCCLIAINHILYWVYLILNFEFGKSPCPKSRKSPKKTVKSES